MKNLKDNVWIEGFDEFPDWKVLVELRNETIGIFDHTLIYQGSPSDIPEEIAKECLSYIDNPENGVNIPFKNYSHMFLGAETAKESIQSACNQEYCIIFKK